MRRIAPIVESKVVSMIVEGKLSYKQISIHTGVAISTIKKIKRRNQRVIERAREVDITQLPIHTLNMVDMQLLNELDRSLLNTTILDDLAESYRNGELSYRQYMKRRRGLRVLTVSQLLAIASYAEGKLEVSLK